MARINFDEVGFRVKKYFKDPDTGKRRQETRRFYQTLNPFNKNSDGSVKNHDQIMTELNEECKKWLGA